MGCHSGTDLAVLKELSEEALEGCHQPSVAEQGRSRGPGQSAFGALGPSEARRAGSLSFSFSLPPLPTPNAVPSLTPNNLLVSPGLCFPRIIAPRSLSSCRGSSWVSPPTPPPAPAPRPGSKAAGVTWSPSSTESAGKAEGESGWKPRNPSAGRSARVPPRPPPRGARRRLPCGPARIARRRSPGRIEPRAHSRAPRRCSCVKCGTIEKTQASTEEPGSHQLQLPELSPVARLCEWHAAPFRWPCVLRPAVQPP